MSKRARIAIVDDHAVLRDGLRLLLTARQEFDVCGEAADADSALEMLRRTRPDLAIIDLSLPGASGVELVKRINQELPETRTLVLTMHEEKLYAERVLRAGARGYLMKHQAADQVVTAIRKVLAGGLYVGAETQESMLDHFLGRGRGPASSLANLTDRELEVMRLIGSGLGTTEIAEALHRSSKTVETHRASLKTKLGLRSGAELTHFATRWLADENLAPPAR